ncbi:AI-2E family transporter [Paenibacillus sp. 598K]|uniref:AI-2E family transporter n=1 Tax=Paenibacillus sp. 598K TaxID=1117987 RepID=UPI000FFA9823|nr:AI-2E family transporter [Paenibacillus sp. 598K]GBF76100.1 AI-2E family transporter [Paenibacillus sp. 598K]
MLTNRTLRISLLVLIWLAIVFVASRVGFLFEPLAVAVRLLIVPVMLCGFLYYLLRPLVELFAGWKVPRSLAVLLVLALLALAAGGSWVLIWPTLVKQTTTFMESLPEIGEAMETQYDALRDNGLLRSLLPENGSLLARISDTLSSSFQAVGDYAGTILDWAMDVVIAISIIPILLFFMLKQTDRFSQRVVVVVPQRYRADALTAMSEIDAALSGFIKGRVIATLLMGLLIFIGFLAIGLPYGLLLALIATLLNFIPYIGPIVGTIPVVIVGLTVSPWMAIWAVLIIIAAQQVEEVLLAPYVYGKSMDIHPLMTVILILAGAELAGFVGLILAIPVYMIIKIAARHAYSLYITDRKQPDVTP